MEGPASCGSTILLQPRDTVLTPGESAGREYTTQTTTTTNTQDRTLAPNKVVKQAHPKFLITTHMTEDGQHCLTDDFVTLQQSQSVVENREWTDDIDSSVLMPSLSFIQPEVDTEVVTTTLSSTSGMPSHPTMFWPQPKDTQQTTMHPEVHVQISAPDPRLQSIKVQKKRPTPPQTLPTKECILPVLRTPPSGILQS